MHACSKAGDAAARPYSAALVSPASSAALPTPVPFPRSALLTPQLHNANRYKEKVAMKKAIAKHEEKEVEHGCVRARVRACLVTARLAGWLYAPLALL